MKTYLISLCLLPMLGCSLMNPPGDGQKPDWDKMAPIIQSRVKYVAMFAFSIDSVKPYAPQVCQAAEDIIHWLETYDNKDATLENVRKGIFEIIANIKDPNVRNAVKIVVEIALTEAFNYAWKYYEEFINQDEAKSAIIIARAIAGGIGEACESTVGSFGPYITLAPLNVFTVPGE